MIQIEVHGIIEAQKALNGKLSEMLGEIHQANVLTGLEIETDAKQRMTRSGAVDTGRARGSIHVETGGNQAKGVKWTKPYYQDKKYYNDNSGVTYDGSLNVEIDPGDAVVGTNVDYAPFIEFGTVHMRARPFLAPAAKQAGPKHIRRLKALLK